MRSFLPFSTNDVLNAIGLQTRRSAASYVLPSLGVLSVGLLTGAGLGLAFAPRRGAETRRMIGDKLSDLGHAVGDTAGTLAKKVTRKAERVVRKTESAAADALADLRVSDSVDDVYGNSHTPGLIT
jgi:gas vesicle protein